MPQIGFVMNKGVTWNEIALIASYNIKSQYPSSFLYEVRGLVTSLDKMEMIFYYLNESDPNNPHHLLVTPEKEDEIVEEIDTTWIGDSPIYLDHIKINIEEAINKVESLNPTYVSLRLPIKSVSRNPKYIFGNNRYSDYKVSVDSVTGEVELL